MRQLVRLLLLSRIGSNVHAEDKPQIQKPAISSSLYVCDSYTNRGFYDPSTDNQFNLELRKPDGCGSFIFGTSVSSDQFLEDMESISDKMPELCNVTGIDSKPYKKIVFQKLYTLTPTTGVVPELVDQCYAATLTAEKTFNPDSSAIKCLDNYYSQSVTEYSDSIKKCESKGLGGAALLVGVSTVLLLTGVCLWNRSREIKETCTHLGDKIHRACSSFWGTGRAHGRRNSDIIQPDDVKLANVVDVEPLLPGGSEQILSPS